MLNYLLMKKAFPIHGMIGIFLLFISEIFLFKKVEPFYGWFYCFAWWSYILTLDAIIYRLKGNSLLINRKKEFFLMIPWSVFIWLVFEAANLALENWYYIYLPHSTAERWLGYGIAYGTVLPGIFETMEFLETLGLFKNSSIKKTVISQGGHAVLTVLGVFCLLSSVLIPHYFSPLVWVGFIFLLEPFNYCYGARSLLRDIEEGNPRKIYLLLCAGLVCGFLWEFWNFWARSRWVYTVPFFEEMKVFEMPLLGFLGFPPFAVQAYVMYNLISLFRYGKGWEKSTYQLNPEKKTRPLITALTSILIVAFSILIFKAIDLKTVDSYYLRLQDAYWIEPEYQKELPRVGIANLDDLISKTREKKERDELALRLLIPKEKLIQWVEKAQLVDVKGMGVENLLLLGGVDIHSISVLAEQDPDMLYEKMIQNFPGRPIPRKGKIRIWVREAQIKVRSSP
ncbi:MAG: hypothetical protein A2V86_13405 [Deltaproteobacteria bacterium RBG_16_49_23]|nr:MAG: hypothetical protein A2V86_13405 [Deltaproteobacteria bacterium RBG_16_49_23]